MVWDLYNSIIMEYEKINFLDTTSNQTTKLRTKNWVEKNDDAGGTYNTNSQIKFKTLILKSNLYDYNDVYLLVSGTITVGNTGKTAASNNRKNVIIKNCAPFSGCISEIRNTQIDNAKDNIIKYSDNLKKIRKFMAILQR